MGVASLIGKKINRSTFTFQRTIRLKSPNSLKKVQKNNLFTWRKAHDQKTDTGDHDFTPWLCRFVFLDKLGYRENTFYMRFDS